MDSRQNRIRLLTRVNRGRTATPIFMAALSDALDLPCKTFPLLPLEESDLLSEAHRAGYKRALKDQGSVSYRCLFPRKSTSQVFPFISKLAGEVATEPVWFLSTSYLEDCGAVELDLQMLLLNAESLLAFDKNSIRVISQDRSQGLLIDYNMDDPDPFECTFWGDRWAVSALLA